MPLHVSLPGAPLAELYFCEECYEIRCNSCVAWDVSSSYCPSCLFEVPGTSVKAQHSRCARSCFACPICSHVLSIVGSDPPRSVALTSAEASVGVAPYFLSCTCCRWDSKRVGIVADKPAGVSAAVTAMEESAWEKVEFDRLRDHVAPLLHMNMDETQTRTGRASMRLRSRLHDIPGVTMRHLLGTHARSAVPPLPLRPDTLQPYEPDAEGRALARHVARNAKRAEYVAARNALDGSAVNVTSTAQRWAQPGDQPYESSALRPHRVRLLTKLCKRCPECRHILVRPELRTSLSTYKIKLLASQFLPSCRVVAATGDRLTLTLTNPLLDAMDVVLAAPAEISATSVQLPPYVEVLDWDDDAGGVESWDPFAGNGVLVEKNAVSLGLRAAGPIPVRIEWRVAGESRTHAFWFCVGS